MSQNSKREIHVSGDYDETVQGDVTHYHLVVQKTLEKTENISP